MNLLDILQGVGDVVDTPGSVVRGLIAGDPGRAFGGILDPSQRVSGREMLGLEEGVGNEILGIGASLATDPLMLLSGLGGLKLLRGGRAVAEAAPAVRAAEEAPALLRTLQAAPEVKAAVEAPALVKAIEAPELAPTFYSRLEQAAAKMPESVKGESLMNVLKKQGGFSQEEAEFRNLAELAQPGRRVTKPELLKHLEENKIGVGEIWKTPGEVPTWDEPFRQATGAKYSSYQTKGGDNYRELLLTKSDSAGELEKLVTKANANGGKLTPDEQLRYLDLKGKQINAPEGYYRSPHFDEPNILAHVRMQDRVGPGGRKILHIEEVQSDWHQTGKKSGYRTPQADAARADAAKRYSELEDALFNLQTSEPGGAEKLARLMRYGPEDAADLPIWEKSRTIMEEMKNLEGVMNTTPVPNAPFKENWHELAMKRALREAAEGGYDAMTWNTGKAIQKQVGGELAGQQQFYDVVLPNWLNKYAKQWGAQVENIPISKVSDIAEAMGIQPKMRPGIVLNDALKQAVLHKGQPLMALPPLLAILAGEQA